MTSIIPCTMPTNSVYPHVRGDDNNVLVGNIARHGLPPRAWGRRFRQSVTQHDLRFTPTCVGTTNEKQTFFSLHRGLPPRAWGRPYECEKLDEMRAVYPHVRGDDVTMAVIDAVPSVYPHVRGDDCQLLTRLAYSDGLPPRAWGRLPQILGSCAIGRFTPTCVGTTTYPQHHPMYLCGLPPRAWGRLIPTYSVGCSGRFTPTCVGTTTGKLPRSTITPVYPHVRGDDIRRSSSNFTYSGLPPRAWGRLELPYAKSSWHRFTPTCVGTTTSVQSCCLPIPVYPHVRGDDAPGGLSSHLDAVYPHVRGDDDSF